LKGISTATRECLTEIQHKSSASEYPGLEEDAADILFDNSYLHKHYDPSNCNACGEGASPRICNTARSIDCNELGCRRKGVVRRTRFARPETPGKENILAPPPSIHFGTIGSANYIMRSGKHRDNVAKDSEIIAFEMEGAGVWDCYPCIIIKSVGDYADSHKNKRWQLYAAATAAACAKAVLSKCGVSQEPVHRGQLTFVCRAFFCQCELKVLLTFRIISDADWYERI
jgi:hypothetical protein